MALDTTVVIQGMFSLVYVIISLIVGITIISKYLKYKQKILILVGLTWIGICEPFLNSSISFLVALINGTGLPIEIYFIIGNIFIPLTIIFWLFAIFNLASIKKRKPILAAYIIFAAIFESIYIFYLLTDVSKLGVLKSPVDIDYATIVIVFLLTNILIFVVGGLLITRESLRSDKPETKLKGKFLLIAFISFLVGAAVDSIVTFPAARLILVFSALTFYIGFILPESVKKRLIK